MDFTSRQLRAFLLVAQHRSFSRAAEVLYITPSGLSVLIRELETAAGLPVVRPHYAACRAHCPRHRTIGGCPEERGRNGRCGVAHRTLRNPSQPVFDFGCAAYDRSQYRHARDQGIPRSPARSSDSVVRRKIACHPTTCPRRQARHGSWHLRPDARYQAYPILSFSSDGDPRGQESRISSSIHHVVRFEG